MSISENLMLDRPDPPQQDTDAPAPTFGQFGESSMTIEASGSNGEEERHITGVG